MTTFLFTIMFIVVLFYFINMFVLGDEHPNKYELQNYEIHCDNSEEVEHCLEKLQMLNYNYNCEEDIRYDLIIIKPHSRNSVAQKYYYDRKIIYYNDFIKLCDYMLKKAISVNEQGQVLAINHYNVNKYVYVVNLLDECNKSQSFLISDLKKSFIEPLIKLGCVFKDEKSLNKKLKTRVIYIQKNNIWK